MVSNRAKFVDELSRSCGILCGFESIIFEIGVENQQINESVYNMERELLRERTPFAGVTAGGRLTFQMYYSGKTELENG